MSNDDRRTTTNCWNVPEYYLPSYCVRDALSAGHWCSAPTSRRIRTTIRDPFLLFLLLSRHYSRFLSIIRHAQVAAAEQARPICQRLAEDAEADRAYKANVYDPLVTKAGGSKVHAFTFAGRYKVIASCLVG